MTKSCKHHRNFGAENKMFEETTRRKMTFSGHFWANFCQASGKVRLLKSFHGTGSFTFKGNQTYLIFVNDSQVKEQYSQFFTRNISIISSGRFHYVLKTII